MIGLLRSELRRALSRRMVRVLFFGALAVIVIAALTTFLRTHTVPAGSPGFAESGGRDPAFHLSHLPGILQGTLVPWAIAAWTLAASLIGAEWRAGSVNTTLTWEPRRIRLIAAKALVAIGVMVTMFIVMQLLLAALLLPSALLHGDTVGFRLATMIGVLARGTAFIVVAASIGFALGSIGRNTAAALGIGFFYLAVGEGLLANFIRPLREFLIAPNAIILVSGRTLPFVFHRSVVGAGVLLLIYAAAALGIASALFSRRDVT